MLNKIKIVGEVVPKSVEIKSLEKEEGEKNELISYFSLLVPCPSGSLPIIRCIAQGETAKKVEKEIKEKEILEVKGYLRNDKLETSRQILVKVVEFTKLDTTLDKVDKNSSNQLRLLGKIVTDFKEPGPELISFRIMVPRERNNLPFFFCRVQEIKLINEVKNKLKRNDIVLLEGFLQTKKLEEKAKYPETKGLETKKNITRISSIICQNFVLLDNDSVNVFNPLDRFTHIVGEVQKIDFTKPKEKNTPAA